MQSNLAYVLNDDELAYFDAYAKKYGKKIYLKKWKDANRDRVRELNREFYHKNRERLGIAKKAHRKKPEVQESRKKYGFRYHGTMPKHVRQARLLNGVKQNAKARGKEFTITFNDVMWNDVCPVLGIEINYGRPMNGRKSDNGPSIDRTDPSKGYIPGNVVCMSWRANRLKCDGTLEEMEKVVSYLKQLKEKENG